MSADESAIEAEYQRLIRSLSPKEKVARSAAMFHWFRSAIFRQVKKEDEGREIAERELK